MYIRKKISIFILLLISGVFLISVFILPRAISEKNSFYQIENLKTLDLFGYHNLTESIIIDDSDQDYNWSKTAIENDWCSGSGTWADPYIIEKVYINNHDISIRNSEVYFYIQNSIIFNGAISFWDTQNGKLLNTTCSNGSYGVFIRRVQNFTISGNFLNNISYAMDLEEINNTVISRNIICDVYTGIHAWRGENITISENMINALIHPYFVPTGIEVLGSNFSLLNNVIENGKILIYADASIYGNQIYGSGFLLDLYNNIEFGGSNLVNNKPVYFYENKTGLRPADFINAGQVILYNCNDSIISNLEISYTYRSLYLRSCNNNTISYNTFSNNQERGIDASGSNHIIENNIISNNNVGGLDLGGCYNCLIRDNIIHKNQYNIEAIVCNNNTFSGNTISGSTMGVFLRYSDNNTFINNRVVKSGAAITWSGKNNTISSNLIKDNYYYGISMGDSGNLIYYNCFINNSRHAYDNGAYNRWDNGVVGNYWDNYTGLDADGNGIGDVPYVIAGSAGSQDNFPLMNCPISTQDGGGIPIELIILISVISGGAVIGVAALLLIRRKRKSIQ